MSLVGEGYIAEHYRIKQLPEVFIHNNNYYKQTLQLLEIMCPIPRTEAAKASLHYRGSVQWNKIPEEIRHQPNLYDFKTLLQDKVISNTFS